MRDESGRVRYSVGIDSDPNGRAILFDSEDAARTFAHFDHQLEGYTIVVARHDPDGTMTVIEVHQR